jgi:pimeloyl-ACP methyl ester carboxylesterase
MPTKMITTANAQQLPEVAAYVMEMMSSTPPYGAAAVLRGRAQRVDFLPLLKKIQVPTLVVVSSEDVYTPLVLAEQFYEQMPGAKLAVIESAATCQIWNSRTFSTVSSALGS